MNYSDIAILTIVFSSGVHILSRKYLGLTTYVTGCFLNIIYISILVICSQSWVFYPIFVGYTLFSLFFPYADFDTYLSSLIHPVYYQIANFAFLLSVSPYLAVLEEPESQITVEPFYLIIFDLPIGVKCLARFFVTQEKQRTILFWSDMCCRILFPVILCYYGILGKIITVSILFLSSMSWC